MEIKLAYIGKMPVVNVYIDRSFFWSFNKNDEFWLTEKTSYWSTCIRTPIIESFLQLTSKNKATVTTMVVGCNLNGTVIQSSLGVKLAHETIKRHLRISRKSCLTGCFE